MKTIILLLLSVFASFSQDLTNEIYWASQPAEVRVLSRMSDLQERLALAESLARAGYKIDVPIMVYQWDAFKVMSLRKTYGFTWVPSALQQNIEIAPGLVSHGATPYDPLHPPDGSIKVSTAAVDYPPFKQAVEPVVDTTVKSPVGLQSIGNLYLTVTGDTLPNGTYVKEPRGTFIKRVQVSPFGSWAYWEKVEVPTSIKPTAMQFQDNDTLQLANHNIVLADRN